MQANKIFQVVSFTRLTLDFKVFFLRYNISIEINNKTGVWEVMVRFLSGTYFFFVQRSCYIDKFTFSKL